MSFRHTLLPLSLSGLLVACSSQPAPPVVVEPPVVNPPAVIEIPQATGAIPRPEPLSTSGNRDYWIGKQKNLVWRDIKHYSEEGTASWLAQALDGQPTANGDLMDSTLFSAAHRNLPIPSYVRVTNLDNGLETIVRVNDRGPFNSPRLIDLSYAAAKQLAMVDSGEARVRLELINDTPDQMIELAPMAITPAPPASTAPATKPATQAPAPVKRAVPPPQHQGKMIQVLASGSRERAEAMGQVMTQRHQLPYRVEAHGALFRVLIGPVAADQQVTTLEQIRQGGLEQAFIVP